MNKFFQNTCKPQGAVGKLMVTMMNKGHAGLAGWGLSHLALRDGMDILDIGCGGGANLAAMLLAAPQINAVGMDYSSVSVEKSRQTNNAAVRAGRCRIIQGDASALPFEGNSFDLITAFETVYFWPELDSCFRQVCHTLCTGGIFLICNEESDPENDRWSKLIQGMTIYSGEDLKDRLEKAGFADVSYEYEEKRHWLCITAKKA